MLPLMWNIKAFFLVSFPEDPRLEQRAKSFYSTQQLIRDKNDLIRRSISYSSKTEALVCGVSRSEYKEEEVMGECFSLEKKNPDNIIF